MLESHTPRGNASVDARFLTLWQRADWSWALWCFRGSFGVLDSQRADVSYENWRGHMLDRRMLELLQEFRSSALESR